ncbi:DoxX family protein [Brevundimonas naejangsanensis]|uniref:DoxX family protein n=1 Tax=Brevundimonas naejangsanensis TaxID=588932 RepID=UPI001F09E7EE|nr:DoxX family protein [Brevundimonas naejangsanensis]
MRHWPETYRNLAIWTLQGWLAMFFLAAGYAKLTEPMNMLVILLSWPAQVSLEMVRALGAVEVLLAIAVVAPLFSRSLGRPVLVLASMLMLTLETTMLVIHVAYFDWGHVATNVGLILITAPVFMQRTREAAPN